MYSSHGLIMYPSHGLIMYSSHGLIMYSSHGLIMLNNVFQRSLMLSSCRSIWCSLGCNHWLLHAQLKLHLQWFQHQWLWSKGKEEGEDGMGKRGGGVAYNIDWVICAWDQYVVPTWVVDCPAFDIFVILVDMSLQPSLCKKGCYAILYNTVYGDVIYTVLHIASPYTVLHIASPYTVLYNTVYGDVIYSIAYNFSIHNVE